MQITLRVIQFLIALAVVWGCIIFEKRNNYPINPMLIGVWAFVASYGFTLAWTRIADWRLRRLQKQR